MHRFAETGDFGQKMQEAELDYLIESRAAASALAGTAGRPAKRPFQARSARNGPRIGKARITA